MTQQEIREFNQSQVEWYKKEIAWTTEELQKLNKELKELKARDKEWVEMAWNTGVIDPWSFKIYGKDFKSNDTRKVINLRDKKYRDNRYFKKMLDHYTNLVNEED